MYKQFFTFYFYTKFLPDIYNYPIVHYFTFFITLQSCGERVGTPCRKPPLDVGGANGLRSFKLFFFLWKARRNNTGIGEHKKYQGGEGCIRGFSLNLEQKLGWITFVQRLIFKIILVQEILCHLEQKLGWITFVQRLKLCSRNSGLLSGIFVNMKTSFALDSEARLTLGEFWLS